MLELTTQNISKRTMPKLWSIKQQAMAIALLTALPLVAPAVLASISPETWDASLFIIVSVTWITLTTAIFGFSIPAFMLVAPYRTAFKRHTTSRGTIVAIMFRKDSQIRLGLWLNSLAVLIAVGLLFRLFNNFWA